MNDMQVLGMLLGGAFPNGQPTPLMQLRAPQEQAVEAPSPAVPFYPNARYLQKKWAPEQSLTLQDLSAIARASQTAGEQGVLSKELLEYVLPIAMVEGRGAGMGVLMDQPRYASRRFTETLQKMGLQEGEDYEKISHRGEPHYRFLGDGYDPRRALAVLAEKAAVAQAKGSTRPEDVVKLYNGRGRAVEELGNGRWQQADVNTYWSKVQAALHALAFPENAKFIETYRGGLK
jgi:hypothetical protein